MASIAPSSARAPATAGRRRAGSGEPFVWLAGMGLVTGLLMITALLLLILVKGVEAFWPLRLARIALTAPAAERLGQPFLYGHIIGTTEKRVGEPDESGQRPMEYKLQVGNRDVTGTGFMYLDVADVASIEFPDDLVRIDRVEYGPALGTIVSVAQPGQPVLEGPAAIPVLQRLVSEGNARRARIERIEKRDIGDVNAALEVLRRERRRLGQSGGGDAASMASIESREQDLEAQYERLAADTRELRAQQDAASFTYRLAKGEERTIPVANVVAVHFPNQPGFLGRVGQAIGNT